jgi:predicted peptidase
MDYLYYTEFAAPAKRPLLLYLHGYGEIGGDGLAQTTKHGPWSDGQYVQNARVLDQLAGYVRIGPHLQENGFWDPDLLKSLVLRIRQRRDDVAPNRLFVAGISRGGMGALELAAAHAGELGVAGMAVCCPERVERLQAALAGTPVYLFHGDGDDTVKLNAARVRAYEDLRNRANCRWVRVRPDKTSGATHHNCWTHLFGHPDLYRWFARLAEDPDYRNRKDAWPDFADLAIPTPGAG